jgi:hypothetical protein
MRFWGIGLLGWVSTMSVLALYVTEPVDCANVTASTAPIYNPPVLERGASTSSRSTIKAEKKTPQTTNGEPEDTPEEKQYKLQMIQVSNAIQNKITEIEAKQRDIDSEPYFSQIPALRGEKKELEIQLKALEMRRDQIQSQKTVRDFANDLTKPHAAASTSPSSPTNFSTSSTTNAGS